MNAEPNGRVPEPTGCTTPAELVDRLIELRRWSGQPSLRRLRQLGGTAQALDGVVVDALPQTTVSAVLRRRRSAELPRLPFVEAFVAACMRACGRSAEPVQLEEWRRVWRSLATPEGAGQVVRGDAGGAPVPHQLPLAARTFTGRRDALAALGDWLARAGQEPAAPVPVCLTGPEGVGKSALVMHWVREVADRFPDGQLYAELRGSGRAEPATAYDVIGRFLRALGSEPVPADYDERVVLYRSVLAASRSLIVLDDALSSAQVRPLLPGTAGCAVVVTSRHDLRGLVAREGAKRIVLGPLAEREAVSALIGMLGTNGPAMDNRTLRALASRSRGCPLQLRIEAERWLRDPGSVLRRLGGHGAGADGVQQHDDQTA